MEAAMDGFHERPYVVAPLIVFTGLVGWWLKERTIAGLKGRISVFEDRLKLAAEQAESAREAKDEVATEFETYKAEVAARVENAALGAGRDSQIRGRQQWVVIYTRRYGRSG
jgi:F0F1-type ATP synthase membrane subunit b/b'